MHKYVAAMLNILHCWVSALLQMLKDNRSLHVFSGCWKWNKSMCVGSARMVLLCFPLSSFSVSLCHVAYGHAVQESCICMLTSVVGSLGQA